MTIFPKDGQPIEVLLDESDGSRTCAIAMLESNGEELSIRREVRYVNGAQRVLDEAYGWGLNWSTGSKS